MQNYDLIYLEQKLPLQTVSTFSNIRNRILHKILNNTLCKNKKYYKHILYSTVPTPLAYRPRTVANKTIRYYNFEKYFFKSIKVMMYLFTDLL